jgi:hypothetical protein
MRTLFRLTATILTLALLAPVVGAGAVLADDLRDMLADSTGLADDPSGAGSLPADRLGNRHPRHAIAHRPGRAGGLGGPLRESGSRHASRRVPAFLSGAGRPARSLRPRPSLGRLVLLPFFVEEQRRARAARRSECRDELLSPCGRPVSGWLRPRGCRR